MVAPSGARNLVDFENGFYAGEMLKVGDIARPTASMARNSVDWNNGLYAGELPLYAGEMPKVDARVIDEHSAPNLVDFQNGFYAGEMLKVDDIARPTASTELPNVDARVIDEHSAPNLGDFQNGFYAGEIVKVLPQQRASSHWLHHSKRAICCAREGFPPTDAHPETLMQVVQAHLGDDLDCPNS